MPRTNMGKTEAQRIEERYERLRKCIGDRVVVSMHRNRNTQEDICRNMAMGHNTVRKLTDGEDVTMTTTKFLQILDLAGLVLVDRKKDDLEGHK